MRTATPCGRSASLIVELKRCVCALRHHAGTQYSVVKWSWVDVAVGSITVPATRTVLAYRFCCKVAQGVGYIRAFCPKLLRGIWPKSKLLDVNYY